MIETNKNIILYSTGCPICRQLMMLLKKKGVVYEENNNVDEMVKLGFTRVPMLVVDGTAMNYQEAKKWAEEKSEENE